MLLHPTVHLYCVTASNCPLVLCYCLLQDLKPYNGGGFYRYEHYLNVDSLGSTDVCLLINSGELKPGSSMDSEKDVEEVYFITREFRLNGGGLPEEVVQRCDKLRKSERTHDNVVTFLGLIVEERTQPLTYSAAHVFEEFAEGE